MLETVKKIIYQTTGKKNITMETDFIKDLALNSFDIMNMVCKFEDRYDITIAVKDVWKLRKVKDVIQYLKKRGINE